MSRVEDLLTELCPQGVNYKRLEEVATLHRGRGLAKKDIATGDVPVILYGELYTAYGDYISQVISKASQDRATSGTPLRHGDILMPMTSTTKDAAIGKASALVVDGPVYLGGDAIALRHNQVAGYLVHLLNSPRFEVEKMKHRSGTTVSHLSPTGIMGLEIPIPPLEVQREIVRILDEFTELEAELEAELESRRRQFEYYRNELLSSRPLVGEARKRLDEVCELVRGQELPVDERLDGEYSLVTAGKTELARHNAYNYRDPSVTVTSHGAYAGFVNYWSSPIWLGNNVFLLEPSNQVNVKFLFYSLKNMESKIQSLAKGGGVPYMNWRDIASIDFAFPQLDRQIEIVQILDQFVALLSALETELLSRRKQYEYYRDKLLTFPEAAA